MSVIITDISVVCCLSVLDLRTKTSKFGIQKQNRSIGTRIPVDSLFLTWLKYIEFVEHYEFSVAHHLRAKFERPI